jgi:hypothetical protein
MISFYVYLNFTLRVLASTFMIRKEIVEQNQNTKLYVRDIWIQIRAISK